MIELTERHLQIPYALASRFARQHTDAYEELVCAGNLALAKARHWFDPARLSKKTGKPVSFTTYAYTAVHRELQRASGLSKSYVVAADGSRKLARRHEDRWRLLGELDAPLPSGQGTLADRIESRPERSDELSEETAALLALLKPADRAAYVLYHGHGLASKDVAARLGVTRQMVQMRLKRAQKTLDGRLLLARLPLKQRGSPCWYALDETARRVYGPGPGLAGLLDLLGLDGPRPDNERRSARCRTAGRLAACGLRLAAAHQARKKALDHRWELADARDLEVRSRQVG